MSNQRLEYLEYFLKTYFMSQSAIAWEAACILFYIIFLKKYLLHLHSYLFDPIVLNWQETDYL